MKITLKNWDKYNKRQKDIRRPFWFAHSNEIFFDPFYSDLNVYERQAFLYILCEASRQNKYGEVELSEKLFTQVTGYKSEHLLNTIDKLLKLKAAAGSRQDAGRNATATEQNITEHTIVHPSDKRHKESGKWDFEIPYQNYPRKHGKARGMEVLKQTIKTETEFEDFCIAVENYAAMCLNEKKEKQFIKLFDTFVGTVKIQTWKDFLETENINSTPRMSEEEFRRRAFGDGTV